MEEDFYESDDGSVGAATAYSPPGYNEQAPQLNAYQPWNPQAPQLNIPSGEVDWDYVNRAVSAHRQSEALQMQRKTYEAKINQSAVRERGRLKMQQLIEGGATPQEAYRLAGGDLHYQDPKAYASGMLNLDQQAIVPKLEDVDGFKMFNFGNRYQLAPGQTLAQKKPAQTRLNQVEAARMRNRIKALEENEILKADPVKQKRLIDETLSEYESKIKSPEPTVAPISTEKVIVMKDGKKFRLPKSQLEEAQSQGYKLAE